jgi:hypothetical protein
MVSPVVGQRCHPWICASLEVESEGLAAGTVHKREQSKIDERWAATDSTEKIVFRLLGRHVASEAY